MEHIGYLETFYKLPAEAFHVVVDFTDALDTGETVASAVAVAKDRVDESVVTATITGAVTVASPEVTVPIMAGTAGHSYAVKVTATSSNAHIYEEAVLIVVSAPAAVS